jgi:uncharacterized protein (DUF2235 family)
MNGSTQRRGSYPIQTANYEPHQGSHNHVHEHEDTKQPLPRSIRALKDSKQARGHGRTVVICLDGTGDRFDSDNSNVVHFVSCLKKHTPSEQVTYYQSGIGTYDKGGIKNGFGAAMDMAVGSGLGIHVKDAYRFLMQNYREGDKICLLGFSRGAYTVRCLAGMLHKVGLLPASNGAQINFAYDFYKDDSDEGWDMSAQFKKTFCTHVNVYFVGVWDCVASVGFIPRSLPFSKSPTSSIHYFRHAMALDEHRAKFKVCQWRQQDPDLKRRETLDNTPGAQLNRSFKRTGILKLFGQGKPKTIPLNGTEKANGHTNGVNGSEKANGYANGLNGADKTNGHSNGVNGTNGASDSRRSSISLTEEEKQAALEAKFNAWDASRQAHMKVETDVLEVWFKGCHADIGGGAVKNETRHMLSRIPLRWMIRQCFECDTGILFDTAALADQGLDVHSLYPVCKPVCKPPTDPPPSVIEKYENSSFPPLHWRSACLDYEDDEEDKEVFDHDHGVAHLPECTEDYLDGLAPVNDMLVLAKGWWILEIWPVKVRVLARDGLGWEKKVRMNRGRYRAVRETAPKLHWTVERLVQQGKYVIRSRTEKNAHWEIVA